MESTDAAVVPSGRRARPRDRGLLPRAAGGAAGTALVVGGLVAAFGQDADALSLLLVVVAAGAVCTVLSSVLARGHRPSVPLHVLLGGLAGVTGGLVLDGGDGYALIAVLIAGPVGLLGGLLATAVARLTPVRALLPVLVLSVLATAACLAVAVEARRPPHPGSYLVVEGVAGLDALTLAQRAATRLAAAGQPLADRTWSDTVTALLRSPLPEGGRASIGYPLTDGQRLITVDVEGDLACVLVTRDGARALDGACPAQTGG